MAIFQKLHPSFKDKHKQMALIFDPTQVTKLHVRGTQFFGTKSKFKEFKEDVDKGRFIEITDIELECYGYGHFSKDKVLDNFFSYVRGALTSCKHIKMLKINLGGFQLPESKILKKISEDIVKNAKDSIKCLWFHTAHLTNCNLQQFQAMLGLINELSHINFEQISLQFSEWIFTKRQPHIFEVQQCFKRLLQNSRFYKINNQRFRLQMSAWYYQSQLAKQFLKFRVSREETLKFFDIKEKDIKEVAEQDPHIYRKIKAMEEEGDFAEEALFPIKVEEFHSRMEFFIKGLLDMMDHVKEFQIDFRHWHDSLRMKNLKKRLDNVTKKDTYEKSIVSKRIGLEDNQGQNELKMIFVM